MPAASASTKGVQQRVLSVPRAKNPVLVCGLPGSGYVGKLGADHLIDVFKGKKVAEYSCDSFPPQVNVKEDGTAEPLKAVLFYARLRKGRDLFIFTADAQPMTSEGEYELSDAVVSFAKRCGVKTVYTLAAYITGAFSNTPKVYGAGTSKAMLDRIADKGVTLMKDGGISGMNGLLIGVAALRGMEGACLLGETSGYLVDAAASKSVLETLSKIIGVPVDTTKLKEKAEETQKVISQLQGMAEQTRESAAPPRREPRPGYIS
ncbi:MAG: proteasome assembly chaperone family protein [Nitrososphaerales archaeon]|nr:proteasome assembly chaperone family protein [Nitrososphaerales archaeon]